MDIAKFIGAYLECLLCQATDSETMEPLDSKFGLFDISQETLDAVAEDCESFISANAELLAQAGTDEQNGHDFCLTRNGHGAGFWDRGYGEVGKQLSEACKPYGPLDLYIGDDGMLYHHG